MRRVSMLGTAALLTAAVLGAGAPVETATATARTETVESAGPHGPAAEAERRVAEMTTTEQAASIVMGHIPTTDAATLAGYMQDTGIGGFILMGANVPGSEDALRTVTAALDTDQDVPPLIAIDQEGGDVSRLPWDEFPGSRTLKDSPAAETGAAFAARAALVTRAGANVNFGVVADTTADASSFIHARSLGAAPSDAADRVAAAVAAEEPFVASTLKHFPGHGAAPGDSHELIPSTRESLDEWRSSDALPFVAGIEAGASVLMFGHLAYTAVDDVPASLSPRWHDIARDDLGFDGVIVTDDLGMLISTGIPEYADPVANAVAAVTAGSDLVLMIAHSTPDTAAQLVVGIEAAVDDGTLPAERLQEAAERVMTLRLERAASGAVWAPCAGCEPVS
ncbi:glycoside hydrolase family 3 N-terminal domain-containing protein [Microbacterium aerolatum]|uniref:Beta-N-acetylhexosaminidase n=1 Tax=Microbacterium aerolatum TaxID=153731 RepID=A0A511AF07_9MICO|nr:glycoside hydrolase family 3 N-terminal domain-containing protein [Microbacterium aerolatum]GEK86745.1 beta-N-acetylhexosaminidase [Microbacterium aerolatum]GGB25347.1 beta-N-acetylhexosaminidase [Microbacterium aerolatum]